MRAKKYYWHIFFSLILFLLPFFHFGDRLVPSTFNDEFGYWLGASLFTKYDWSLVGAKIPYYSYGYGIILAPIYNFFDNPIIIYRVAIALNGLWLIGSYFCLFKLISSTYEYYDIKIVKVIAFVCTLYASNIMMVNYTLPETFLFFAFSLETYLIYKVCKEYRFIYCVYSIILGIFLLMVHQRTLFILISIIAIMFILLIQKRISLKNMFLCIILVWVGVYCFMYIKQEYVFQIWNNGAGESVEATNSVIDVNNFAGQVNKLQQILSIEGVLNLIYSFFGKCFYEICASVGLGLISFICIVKKIIVDLKKGLVYVNAFQVYLFLCIIGSLLISAIFFINPSAINHIVYGRYTDFIMGPYLVTGIIELVNNKKINYTFYFFISCIISTVGVLVYENFIKTNVKGTTSINTVGISYFVNETELNIYALILCCNLFILLIFFLLKNKNIRSRLIGIILICAVWCFEGNYSYWYFRNEPTAATAIWKNTEKAAVDCYEVIKRDNKNEANIKLMGDINKKWGPYLYLGNYFQFLFYDLRLDYITTMEDVDFVNSYIILPNSLTEQVESESLWYTNSEYSILKY